MEMNAQQKLRPLYEEAAKAAGWTKYQDGRWWRHGREDDVEELLDDTLTGEPLMWTDDAETACDIDNLPV
jgi:hypothetical protein